jgi:hypothetical protein
VSYLWFRQCGGLRGSASHKSTAKSLPPEHAMINGNTTKAMQHSISQALQIEGSFLKKHLCYFRPDGRKSVRTKREQRRAKIETDTPPIFHVMLRYEFFPFFLRATTNSAGSGQRCLGVHELRLAAKQ